MTGSRDYQRRRVYEAERAAERRMLREELNGRPDGQAVPPRNPRLDDAEVQPFVDDVMAHLGAAPVAVELVRNITTAAYDRANRRFVLPPWARNRLTILHEVAHHMTDPLFPSHGTEFIAQELALLEAFMPEPIATYFREAFEDEGLELEPSPKQALRFLSYARRRGGGRVYIITDEPVRYEGDLTNYDRAGGIVTLHGAVDLELDRLRYASWA